MNPSVVPIQTTLFPAQIMMWRVVGVKVCIAFFLKDVSLRERAELRGRMRAVYTAPGVARRQGHASSPRTLLLKAGREGARVASCDAITALDQQQG